MNKLTEQIIPTIAAIEPCYGDGGGNATRIYTTGGECFTDRRRLKSVLEAILRFYNTTLPVMRNKFGDLMDCKHHVPLPLGRDMVLFQYKARSPQFIHDGASGYINLFALKDIINPGPAEKELGAVSLVHLTGGHQLPSLYSCKTMQQRKSGAHTALLHYEKVHGGYNQYSAMVRESSSQKSYCCLLCARSTCLDSIPPWKQE